MDELRIGAPGGERRVDFQPVFGAGRQNIVSKGIVEVLAEGSELARRQRHPCRHGVAATFGDDAAAYGVDDGGAQINPGYRAARAGAATIGAQGNGKGGASEAFLQTCRHQPDDALMPVRGAGHQHRRSGAVADFHFRGGHGLFDGGDFDALAFGIELVQALGQGERFVLVIGGQKSGSEPGISNAPTGIDAGPEYEAQVIRIGRAREPR